MTLEIIKQEITGISVKSVAVIKTPEQMKDAVSLLSRLNIIKDNLTEDKEKITKPMNLALKEVRDKYKPLETKLESDIETIRGAMSVYQTEKIRLEKEEEARIASRVGDGKGKLKVETAVRKIDEIERVDNVVSSDNGLVKFRTDKVLKVVDIDLIDRDYFDLNESRLLKALKAGVEVKGAVLEDKLVAINNR